MQLRPMLPTAPFEFLPCRDSAGYVGCDPVQYAGPARYIPRIVGRDLVQTSVGQDAACADTQISRPAALGTLVKTGMRQTAPAASAFSGTDRFLRIDFITLLTCIGRFIKQAVTLFHRLHAMSSHHYVHYSST